MVEKTGNLFNVFYRPSTPMKLVMGNSYGLEAASVTLDKYYKRSGSQVINDLFRNKKWPTQLWEETKLLNCFMIAIIKN